MKRELLCLNLYAKAIMSGFNIGFLQITHAYNSILLWFWLGSVLCLFFEKFSLSVVDVFLKQILFHWLSNGL